MKAAPPRPNSENRPCVPPIAKSRVGPSQSPSPGGPHPNFDSYTIRIGLLGGTVVHRDPPTLVSIPVKPSPQAIAVGQSVPVTTSWAEAVSNFWLVRGGAPPGKRPSSITSRLTFIATSARPSSELPGPDFERNKPARLV